MVAAAESLLKDLGPATPSCRMMAFGHQLQGE
jgi:hypothetical protein